MSPSKRSCSISIVLAIITVILASYSTLHADVIYFVDGNVLIVQRAWVEGDIVKYETSRGVQSLPKANVARIQVEKNIAPPSAKKWGFGEVLGNPSANDAHSAPATSAATVESRETLSRLRENLRVSPTSARARADLVHSLAAVASLQMAQGDFPGAIVSLQEARSLDDRNLVILQNLAIMHLRTGGFRDAEGLLRAGISINGRNLDLHYLLGEVYYAQERTSEAINEWSSALALGSHPEMSRALDKARQEAGVHDQLGALQSAHFILRYERTISNQELGQQVLSTLERLYAQLSTELVWRPPAIIAVILYPDQTYFNITRAASWSGALFDGKIRIPTKGLTSVTPDLIAILTHELTHAFLQSLPVDSPGWFHEGLAQLQEGQTAARDKQVLARLSETNQLIRLNELEGSFMGFSAERADIAYTESLSAVEFLVEQFGRSSVRSLLDLMAQNYNFENAFRRALGRSLAQFEMSWRLDLLQ